MYNIVQSFEQSCSIRSWGSGHIFKGSGHIQGVQEGPKGTLSKGDFKGDFKLDLMGDFKKHSKKNHLQKKESDMLCRGLCVYG